jgi:hypothetical protein
MKYLTLGMSLFIGAGLGAGALGASALVADKMQNKPIAPLATTELLLNKCAEGIKYSLADPSSYEFKYKNFAIEETEKDNYLIIMGVMAKNMYNAKVRTKFDCKIRMEENSRPVLISTERTG